MPFYDFTREPAREFSLKELVARISELERRRQAGGTAESVDENGDPWRRRRGDRDQNTGADEPDLLKE